MIKSNIIYCKGFLTKLMMNEKCQKRLALSFSMGVYIAFSPFPGFHTAMVFALSWLLSLNLGVVFASSCLINNPWTMIPVYCADYFFGNWLCWTCMGNNMISYNPWWMDSLVVWLSQTIGIAHISLASFLIGGNLLAIGFALVLYPIMRYIFSKLSDEASGLLHT